MGIHYDSVTCLFGRAPMLVSAICFALRRTAPGSMNAVDKPVRAGAWHGLPVSAWALPGRGRYELQQDR